MRSRLSIQVQLETIHLRNDCSICQNFRIDPCDVFIYTYLPSLNPANPPKEYKVYRDVPLSCRPRGNPTIKLLQSYHSISTIFQEVTLLTQILVGSYAANSSSLFIVLCSFKPVSCSSFVISASSLLRPSTVFLISRLDAIS